MAAIEKRKSNDELSSMRTSEGTRGVKSRFYRRRKYLPLVEFIGLKDTLTQHWSTDVEQ